MAVLSINNLSKNYGKIKAVDSLDLKIEAGQVYGLLGPNGSGKTTTLGMILGITVPDAGTFSWFDNGHDKYARRNIGAILETPNFYPFLNAIDNLQIVAHLKKASQTDYDGLLDLVELSHRKKSKFHTYSLGMKQRLAIAGALVGEPDVLIFDEPTNGLDPKGIVEVREILIKIAQTGKTVIMASHILDEVEKVCSHVGILKFGKLLASGPMGSIINNDKMLEIDAPDRSKLHQWLTGLDFIRGIEDKGQFLLAYVTQDIGASEINQLAFNQGLALSRLNLKQRSLESEFLEITQN